MSMKESSEVVINIENCMVEENKKELGDVMMNSIDCALIGDDGEKSSPSSEGKMRKEERRMSMSMSMSAKKPPRPPRGLSLDAADQKLIKEISEIIMMKRARIERMKKKSKAAAAAAKGTSSNSSTTGNLIAMLFTLVFCIVIIFQGGSRSAGTNILSPISGKGDIDDAVGLAIQMNSSSRSSVHTFV